MQINLKRAMLTSVSIAFLSVSAALIGSTPAAAGPLSVTPRTDVAPASVAQTVQYRRSVRATRAGARHHAVRHRAVHYGRPYYRGRYAHRRAYVNPLFPVAALGLFAGALGSAVAGPATYYCDPAYYSWGYGGCANYGYGATYYPAYSSGYYPAYSGAYYPAYAGGYYPAYRGPRVIYRTRYQHPRTVRYRAVAPHRHFVGSRTHVRPAYRVQRVGR